MLSPLRSVSARLALTNCSPRVQLLRRGISDTRFSPFVPPPPSSLPKPKTRTPRPRLRKYGRRLLYTTAVLGGAYAADYYLNYETFSRNLRTLFTCALVAADYKLNFSPGKNTAELTKVHERTADRLMNLCLTNGGLYQKVGQVIAMQSAFLPPVFQEKFSRFFDETPQASYAEIQRVLEEDLGTRFPGPGDIVDRVFEPGSFEKRAIGSASVAQVHRARLRTGETVAVKVQKPWIARQVPWDLFVYRWVVEIFSTQLFKLPLSFMTPFISERLLSETDFVNEASNSERTAEFVQSESSLRGRVYIPEVFKGYTTRRVMVTEWIDGVGLAEREIVTGQYRDDNSLGHIVGTPRSVARREGPIRRIRGEGVGAWDSAHGKRVYGLGFREREIMQSMVDLFCAQMFLFGWVHCDPHPGNILLRRQPNGKPQLVLLDHGLYITTTPKFRHQYALFWKSLLTFDNTTIFRIAEEWGIGNADLFASATIMRPYQGGSKEIAGMIAGPESEIPKTAYERQQMMRQKMAEFLEDQDKMPKELIFIGRNLGIVQANNANYGAPVNRIKIIGQWASYSLTRSLRESGLDRSWRERVEGLWRHMIFKIVVFGLDIGFWFGRIRQKLTGGEGFEEMMQRRMQKVAQDELGFEMKTERKIFTG